MLKRFVDRFVDAAATGSGGVIGGRAGNDVYNWVKSGKAKEALGKLITGPEKPEADVDAHVKKDDPQAARKGAPPARASGSTSNTSDAREEAAEFEQLSEDDVAALRARRHAPSATITVRCTHCYAPKHVARDTELTQCNDCGKRFWIEAADRG